MKKWWLLFPVFVSCFFFSARVEAGNCCGPYQYPSCCCETPPYMPGCCEAQPCCRPVYYEMRSCEPNNCDSCMCPPCGGDRCAVEFGGEFLYRKFCLDEFYWAFTRTVEVASLSEDIVNISCKTLCLDYEPGVRAWLGIEPCGCGTLGLYLSYVYLSGSGDDTLHREASELVCSTILHPTLFLLSDGYTDAAIDWNHYYHEGEVVLGSNISCGKCHQFLPFFGVAGIYLEQKFELDLSDPTVVFAGDIGEVDWKSEYWGVGFRFGSHYKYQIAGCFSFIGRFNASLLVGENKFHNNQSVTLANESNFLENWNFSGDNKCHFVPGYSIGVGFALEPQFCGCIFSMRVGYEYCEWHNIPNHRTFSSDDAINLPATVAYSDSASTRTWGSHGLFAGLYFGF